MNQEDGSGIVGIALVAVAIAAIFGVFMLTATPSPPPTPAPPVFVPPVPTYPPPTERPAETAPGGAVTMISVGYRGCWTGAIALVGASSTTQTVDGCGPKKYSVEGARIVSVTFQKQSDSGDELRVELVSGEVVVASQSTTAAYGVAMVSR